MPKRSPLPPPPHIPHIQPGDVPEGTILGAEMRGPINGVNGANIGPRTESNAQLAAQAMVAAAQHTYDKLVIWQGQEYHVRYKRLGFMNALRCISEARVIINNNANGGVAEAVFRDDIYMKMALKFMVVESPWMLSDLFLESMDDELGSQLTSIVPQPTSFVTGVDEGKKE